MTRSDIESSYQEDMPLLCHTMSSTQDENSTKETIESKEGWQPPGECHVKARLIEEELIEIQDTLSREEARDVAEDSKKCVDGFEGSSEMSSRQHPSPDTSPRSVSSAKSDAPSLKFPEESVDGEKDLAVHLLNNLACLMSQSSGSTSEAMLFNDTTLLMQKMASVLGKDYTLDRDENNDELEELAIKQDEAESQINDQSDAPVLDLSHYLMGDDAPAESFESLDEDEESIVIDPHGDSIERYFDPVETKTVSSVGTSKILLKNSFVNEINSVLGLKTDSPTMRNEEEVVPVDASTVVEVVEVLLGERHDLINETLRLMSQTREPGNSKAVIEYHSSLHSTPKRMNKSPRNIATPFFSPTQSPIPNSIQSPVPKDNLTDAQRAILKVIKVRESKEILFAFWKWRLWVDREKKFGSYLVPTLSTSSSS
uniref:Uncharacterized protein n=1 Tax=Attheya septentrionalis TaxID=420275 RepID=A0A7S2XKV9_9STRA|mmetsp:Transcript_17438/g.31469  ORF Transcript_17438/g.31469 Transcript_17438/m.31469 type:complete len:427 (+) Transcript_17438:70-1350(+)